MLISYGLIYSWIYTSKSSKGSFVSKMSNVANFCNELRSEGYAIVSLNATYRKLNCLRRVFPSDTALLKALYLLMFEATKKWTMPTRNWGRFTVG